MVPTAALQRGPNNITFVYVVRPDETVTIRQVTVTQQGETETVIASGVQPPERYTVEFWDGKAWREARGQKKSPALPAGGQVNTVTFERFRASKVRVVFTHADQARSGLSEIEVWAR